MLSRFAAKLLPLVPKPVVARVARRYIAGESRGETVQRVAALHSKGLLSTVDLLGENVESEAAATEVVDEYIALLDDLKALDPSATGGPYVSVKPTHVGLRLSEELVLEGLTRIVDHAAKLGGFVRLDMEDVTTTDATIRFFRALRERTDRVGMAIQAYLHRSLDDIEALLPLKPNLRICKGIYRESPKHAMAGFSDIRENYLRMAERLLEGGGFAALATHDSYLIDGCRELAKTHDPNGERHEFQMLLGVRQRLWPTILERGESLRIYCPYGADWYDYSVRRLRENPQMIWQVMRGSLIQR